MAAADVITENSVTSGTGVTSENVSYLLVKDAKGEIKPYPEDKGKEVIEKEGGTEVLSQTFKFYKAISAEGAHELVPDAEEFTNLFNRGLTVKQQNKARQIINARGENDEPVFEPVELYDMREECAEPTQRRGLSPVEKAKKVLAGLSPEDISKLMALMQSAQ